MSSSPRIPPLSPAEWSPQAHEAFATINPAPTKDLATAPNVAMILAHHPALAKVFFGMGRHFLKDCSLPDRARELATLRVVSRYPGGEYERVHHVRFARRIGLTDEEIQAASGPLESSILSGSELCVLRAVDNVSTGRGISDQTWDELTRYFDRPQIMDLAFLVGLYVMASLTNAALGVEVEEGARA
jgi:alkylhydroperoxidase family enzyme